VTRIALILGSVTLPGRLHRVMKAVALQAQQDGKEVDFLDLADFRLDFVDGRPAADHDDDSSRLIELIDSADCVVLASPVYRGTYTGALKNLLDWLPVEALHGKPVGIVAMGATTHHYLGVDWQLRAVLQWFGALTVPGSVYLTSADFTDGAPKPEALNDLSGLVALLEVLAGSDSNLGPRPLALSSRT